MSMNDTRMTYRDIELFAHYAGAEVERWQELIGQGVTHANLGRGTIIGVEPGTSGVQMKIRFIDSDKPSHTYLHHQLSNESLFPGLAITLGDERREQLRTDLQQADRKNAAANERRRLAQASAQSQRAKPSPSASRPHKVPTEALRDVLSVPTGNTHRYIIDYEVHAHPLSYSYRTTRYITFRMAGGRMWKIYDLGRAQIFSLNPHAPVAVRERIIATLPITDAEKQRVHGYFADRMNGGHFEKEYNEDFTFYVLPADGNIDLPHRPHRAQPIQNHTYFDLDELVRGETIVRTLTDKGIER